MSVRARAAAAMRAPLDHHEPRREPDDGIETLVQLVHARDYLEQGIVR